MSSRQKLKPLLKAILTEPTRHAALLNTFSYLEYIGFSKIVKSQDVARMDLTTLQHTGEELRHAQLLKKLSIKVGGARFAGYEPENMLCGDAAREYFETVDHSCDEILQDPRLCYLYVTWLVEVRALEVYGEYLEILRATGGTSALESLLKEEDRHLQEVTDALATEDPYFKDRQGQVGAIETHAYEKFLDILESAVQRPATEVHAH